MRTSSWMFSLNTNIATSPTCSCNQLPHSGSRTDKVKFAIYPLSSHFLQVFPYSVMITLFLLLVLPLFLLHGATAQLNPVEHPILQWTVEMNASPSEARKVAVQHGLVYEGMLREGVYIVSVPHRRSRSRRSSSSSSWQSMMGTGDGTSRWYQWKIAQLQREHTVSVVEQQVARVRVKRSVVPPPPPLTFNDPLWPKMWYLNGEVKTRLSMNVAKVWQRGFTGQGITVVVLDDGLEFNHPDIATNYERSVSYDLNNEDPSPEPRYVSGPNDNRNHHGTRCAGTIAATGNNSVCGLGVAFNARIGGIRMLDGDVTDVVEAKALAFARNLTHIYSSSWGPDDNGKRMEGPNKHAQQSFLDGVTYGREGLGSIFVWASGNGGRKEDDCNCDGYTNSIYTISISSVSENARAPWYSEMCSSTLAAAFSSNTKEERAVITTDIQGECIENHSGTSASAPLATGVCALTLSANPRLTWRDLQHIIVRTAKPEGLLATDWALNGVGRRYSHSFGYGLLDADSMVTEALSWKTVPPQHTCEHAWTDRNEAQSDEGPFPFPNFILTEPQQPTNRTGQSHGHRPYQQQERRSAWEDVYEDDTESTLVDDQQERRRAERYQQHKLRILQQQQHQQQHQGFSGSSGASASSVVMSSVHWRRTSHQEIKAHQPRTFTLFTDACQERSPHSSAQSSASRWRQTLHQTGEAVHYLEHVQARVSLATQYRGLTQLWLTSPRGTVSQLLHRRKNDDSKEPIQWTFMSVHFWGENPQGVWKLRVMSGEHGAVLRGWSLVFYGTTIPPYPERRSSRDSKGFEQVPSSTVQCPSLSLGLLVLHVLLLFGISFLPLH